MNLSEEFRSLGIENEEALSSKARVFLTKERTSRGREEAMLK